MDVIFSQHFVYVRFNAQGNDREINYDKEEKRKGNRQEACRNKKEDWEDEREYPINYEEISSFTRKLGENF